MEKDMKCQACGAALSGGLDTFGPPGFEFCWDCWSDLGGQDESLYSLAPPVQDMSGVESLWSEERS